MNRITTEQYLNEFQIHFPDFKSFIDPGTEFDREERLYKLELVKLYQDTVASDLENFQEDEIFQIALGKKLSKLFTTPLKGMGNKPQNLVGFRYFGPLQFKDSDGAIWAKLVRELTNGKLGLVERIDLFVNGLQPIVLKNVRNNSVAFNALSRSVTSFLLMLSDKDQHVIIKTQEFNRALKKFGQAPMSNKPLDGNEYQRILDFLENLKNDLIEMNLAPRDMIDVQSFIWVGDGSTYKPSENSSSTPAVGNQPAIAQFIKSDAPTTADLEVNRIYNRIYYGPPGTGKTYQLVKLLKKDYGPADSNAVDVVNRFSFVTFHQSYGYEDFIEGLRPLLKTAGESGDIQYEIRPGIFKELCRKAELAPDQRFAMVIDEINRGNISKIFGELITLIEPDKRKGAENALSVSLPYSGELFSVPANVDIIGAMNTADRSLALLDTALRRRFDFVPLMPDTRNEVGAPLHDLRVTQDDQIIDIAKLLGAINQRIEALYDRDHCIGHAYFTSLRQFPDGEERFAALAEIFQNRIVPLLEEYFFEDWQKIELVLADNQKKSELARFVIQNHDQQQDFVRLFGGNHNLDTYATKPRYSLQKDAFKNPYAYIGIYLTLAP